MPRFRPPFSTWHLLRWICLCWLGLIGAGWSCVAVEFGESIRTSHPTSGQEGNCGLMLESFPQDEARNRTGVLYGGTGRRLVSTYDALQRLQTCTETQDSVPADDAHPAALRPSAKSTAHSLSI